MPFNPFRSAPPPAEMPLTTLTLCCTAIWLIVAVVLTVYSADLAATGRGWWVSCAWVGSALGIPGTLFMVRHERRQRKRR